MKKLFTILLLFVGVCSYTQTSINLITGATITNEKRLFKDPTMSSMPIPFFRFGIGITTKDNFSFSIDYVFDIKQYNITTIIPIWKNKKK